MLAPKELLRRARASEDGEAYVAVARGTGFRLGLGARASAESPGTIFVEVILDPFPDRPRVTPERLADQAELVECLLARGYRVLCDPDSTIACERAVTPGQAVEELRRVTRLLGAPAAFERAGDRRSFMCDVRSEPTGAGPRRRRNPVHRTPHGDGAAPPRS